VVAGSWYPSAPDALKHQLDGYLRAETENAGGTRAGAVFALIAPHAGYVYSGAIAGKGFRHLRDARFDRVILLGPSHHAAFQGAALPEAETYVTPLGKVPIDSGAVKDLSAGKGIQVTDRPFQPEHCLEMEIPFLQHTLEPGWRLLPVLIGGGSTARSCGEVIDALLPLLDAETLVVVSSDFTHFGPRFAYTPFRKDLPERIRALDMGAVDRIVAADRAGFQSYVDRTGATICGRRAIDVLLGLAPAGLEVSLVAYDTSGSITGDWINSVSYASVLFRRPAA
jgi:AmmeMemoRadiSam system protein B